MQGLRDSRKDGKDVIFLFHGPSTESLAKSILEQEPELIRRGDIDWNKFEDGFPNLMIRNVDQIRGRDVAILVSFLNNKELLSQISVIYSLPRYLVRSLIIILPYFPTGTMERVDEEGQIATAMTFARMLSATPLTVGGPTKLLVYDIHALQNRFYFGDSVIPLLVSGIPVFIDRLKTHHSNDKIVIAFPDEGACKRFGKKFQNWPIVTCIKVRVQDKRIVKIKEGEEYLPSAHVFIVDDLVKTGGTLIECKNALTDHGASKVSAFVTHAVFPQESWRKFTDSKVGFSYFYTTDSCPETIEKIKDQPPFQILSLSNSIADNILKF